MLSWHGFALRCDRSAYNSASSFAVMLIILFIAVNDIPAVFLCLLLLFVRLLHFNSAFNYDFAEAHHFLMFRIKRQNLFALFVDTSHVIKNSGVLFFIIL